MPLLRFCLVTDAWNLDQTRRRRNTRRYSQYNNVGCSVLILSTVLQGASSSSKTFVLHAVTDALTTRDCPRGDFWPHKASPRSIQAWQHVIPPCAHGCFVHLIPIVNYHNWPTLVAQTTIRHVARMADWHGSCENRLVRFGRLNTEPGWRYDEAVAFENAPIVRSRYDRRVHP